MTFSLRPDEPDPRRSQEARREDQDELEEFENITDEVAREDGDHLDEGSVSSRGGSRHKKLKEREEFEDLTGEVTREDDENA